MAGAAKYQPYPAYKPSGVEWLGDIPEGWEVAALKHSVSVPITDGPHETPHFIDEGIPFVSAEAVSSGHIDFNKIRSHISQKDHDRYSQKYLPAFGDIYLVKSGATTGVTAIVETDEVFNIWSPLAAIRCNDEMVPKFVLHFLRSAQFQEAIRLYWSFGTQQNIGMKVIENLQTAVPCKQEQTKIAAFLDHETAKIDALIAKQQRMIALLEEKRQAVISHAVTKGLNPSAPLRPSGIDWLGDVPAHWEVKRLKYLGDAWNGLTYSPDDVVPEGEGTLVLRSSNIQSARLAFHDNVYVKGRIPEKVRVIEGDLLICSRNGSRALIGKNAQITSDLEGSAFGAFMCIFRSEMNDYLSVVLNSTLFEFQSGTFLTSTINQLTTGNLLSFEIPLPPAEERAIIVNFSSQQVAKFNELLDKAQSAITLLKERRTALISAAVTGKIDLRDWRPPASATARTADISKDEFA